MDNWREALPEEMQSNPTLSKFDSLEALANSYVEMEQYQGNSIRIPSESAGEADLASFHEKLRERVPSLVSKPDETDPDGMAQFFMSMGRPETGDGYETIEGLGEQDAFMREVALEANLTDKQYKAFVSKLTERAAAEQEGLQEASNQAREAYFATLGDKKDTVLEQLKLFANQTGMDDDLQAAIGPEGNPAVMKYLDTLRKKISTEGGELQRQTGEQGDPGVTLAEAEEEVTEIIARMNSRDSNLTPAVKKTLDKRLRYLMGLLSNAA
jgi:hypothetical protein